MAVPLAGEAKKDEGKGEGKGERHVGQDGEDLVLPRIPRGAYPGAKQEPKAPPQHHGQ